MCGTIHNTIGPVAQWWSRGLIILWLQVRILPGPPFSEVNIKLLEDKIIELGEVREGNILKVDMFLNHQINTEILDQMAEEIIRLYKNSEITKVFTIESSGIAVAYPVAQKLRVPLVFAKKSQSINIDGDVYSSKVESFTHKRIFNVIVSKKYLNCHDKILIIDDFLANGNALNGLLSICEQAQAKVEGMAIAIEKRFQNGGNKLRKKGYRVESLAMIDSIDAKTNKIIFHH